MTYSQFRTIAAALIQEKWRKDDIKAYFNEASESDIFESVNNIQDGIEDFSIYDNVIYCADLMGVCEKTQGLYVLDDLIYTEDEYLVHKEHVTEIYICSNSSRFNNTLYYCYIRNARDKYQVVKYEDQYYDIDCLHEHDLVLTEECDVVHIDDAYWWESDECWHTDEEPEGEVYNELFSYHSQKAGSFLSEDKGPDGFLKAGIGFEIEKSEMPNFDFNARDILEEHQAVLYEFA